LADDPSDETVSFARFPPLSIPIFSQTLNINNLKADPGVPRGPVDDLWLLGQLVNSPSNAPGTTCARLFHERLAWSTRRFSSRHQVE
jgi:hypothetical protein